MLKEKQSLFLYCSLPLEGAQDELPSLILSFGVIHMYTSYYSAFYV